MTAAQQGGEGSSSDGDGEEDVLLEFLSLQPEELWTHMMQRNGSELQVGSMIGMIVIRLYLIREENRCKTRQEKIRGIE